MGPGMGLQIGQLWEGLAASLMRALVWLLACVGPDVLLEVRQLSKVSRAYIALMGLQPEVDSCMLCQITIVSETSRTSCASIGFRLSQMRLEMHLMVRLCVENLPRVNLYEDMLHEQMETMDSITDFRQCKLFQCQLGLGLPPTPKRVRRGFAIKRFCPSSTFCFHTWSHIIHCIMTTYSYFKVANTPQKRRFKFKTIAMLWNCHFWIGLRIQKTWYLEKLETQYRFVLQ